MAKLLTDNEKILRADITRYKSNKLSSGMALLGLVFNCLYFLLLYSLNNNYFYTIEIGISIVLTLISLLTIFLSSEGIKGYNKIYSIVLTVMAVVQIVRIFTTPALAVTGHSWFIDVEYPSALTGHYFGAELTPQATCTILIIYLVASAACLIVAAVTGYIAAVKRESYIKKLESGEIDIDKTLVEEENQATQIQAAESAVEEGN